MLTLAVAACAQKAFKYHVVEAFPGLVYQSPCYNNQGKAVPCNTVLPTVPYVIPQQGLVPIPEAPVQGEVPVAEVPVQGKVPVPEVPDQGLLSPAVPEEEDSAYDGEDSQVVSLEKREAESDADADADADPYYFYAAPYRAAPYYGYGFYGHHPYGFYHAYHGVGCRNGYGSLVPCAHG